MRPDAVIVATGGLPTLPDIPGIEKKNVISNAVLHGKLKSYLRFLGPELLRKLTKFYMPIGKRVVIIGSGIQGCELGEFLTKRGRKVTIVDQSDMPGEGMVDALMSHLFIWFEKKGVEIISGVKSMEVTDTGLSIITKEGKKQTIEADSIIPVLPMSPDNSLTKILASKVSDIHAIGDCNEPNLIVDAIAAGSRVARNL